MVSEIIWNEIRVHYVQLCELVEFVDENLACIILLSCANDLYFVCFQLLNIFKYVPFIFVTQLVLFSRNFCLNILTRTGSMFTFYIEMVLFAANFPTP